MTGSLRSRRDERLIVALLSEATIAAAAKAGVSERTARRRLAESDFQAAYQHARREAVTGAVGRLQALLGKAAGTLERNVDSGVPAVEVRAAVAAFELAFRAADQAEPGARGASATFPYFDPEAELVRARSEAAAIDFSDLAREYQGRLRLQAMAEEARRQMQVALAAQHASEVMPESAPTGTSGATPEAASRRCGSS